LVGHGAEVSDANRVTWKECLRQPAVWYGGAEAARMADNVLLSQLDSGAWAKNLDMAKPLTEQDKATLAAQKKQTKDSTIDNGATYTQMAFLARVNRKSVV
jgi:hypothetical protein